jgi:hypothetical protein
MTRTSKEERRAERAANLPQNRDKQALVYRLMRAGVTSRYLLGAAIDGDGLAVWRVQRQLAIRGFLKQDKPGGRYQVVNWFWRPQDGKNPADAAA